MLYNAVLFSAAQQHESIIIIFLYFLSFEKPLPAPIPLLLGHHKVLVGMPVLHVNVYISMLISQFILLPLSHAVYTNCCLCLHLHFFSSNRFTSTIFLYFIYIC